MSDKPKNKQSIITAEEDIKGNNGIVTDSDNCDAPKKIKKII